MTRRFSTNSLPTNINATSWGAPRLGLNCHTSTGPLSLILLFHHLQPSHALSREPSPTLHFVVGNCDDVQPSRTIRSNEHRAVRRAHPFIEQPYTLRKTLADERVLRGDTFYFNRAVAHNVVAGSSATLISTFSSDKLAPRSVPTPCCQKTAEAGPTPAETRVPCAVSRIGSALMHSSWMGLPAKGLRDVLRNAEPVKDGLAGSHRSRKSDDPLVRSSLLVPDTRVELLVDDPLILRCRWQTQVYTCRRPTSAALTQSKHD